MGPLAHIQNLQPSKSKGPNLQYTLYLNLESHKGIYPYSHPNPEGEQSATRLACPNWILPFQSQRS